MKDCVSDTAVF